MKLVELDQIDKEILVVLLKNGRISVTELARTIKHHYPTVRFRLNNLVERKVINYFYPVVQLPGIGARRYMSIYLNLKNITAENQKILLKELCKNPFIIEVSELEGRWNISLLLVCNYVKEAYETLNQVQELCGDNLADLIVMPTYTISNLNRKFFSDVDLEVKNIKTGYAPVITKTPLVHLASPLKLTPKDIKLLDYLKLNAGDTREEIGKAIQMEPRLVDYKIRKLISNNLIKYFTIDVNSSVLGYEQYLLFLNLRGNSAEKKKLIEDLKKIKEAYHYFEYLNYWEIVVTFCVKNRDDMLTIFSKFKEKYQGIIKDHEILWLIQKHKSEPYPDVKIVYGKK